MLGDNWCSGVQPSTFCARASAPWSSSNRTVSNFDELHAKCNGVAWSFRRPSRTSVDGRGWHLVDWGAGILCDWGGKLQKRKDGRGQTWEKKNDKNMYALCVLHSYPGRQQGIDYDVQNKVGHIQIAELIRIYKQRRETSPLLLTKSLHSRISWLA